MTAVARYGDDLEAALTWLLEGGADSTAVTQQLPSGSTPEVDVTEELDKLAELQASLASGSHPGLLFQAVVDAGGARATAAASPKSVVVAAYVSYQL